MHDAVARELLGFSGLPLPSFCLSVRSCVTPQKQALVCSYHTSVTGIRSFAVYCDPHRIATSTAAVSLVVLLTLWAYPGELPGSPYVFDEGRGTRATNVRRSCGPERVLYLVELAAGVFVIGWPCVHAYRVYKQAGLQ